MDEGVDKIALAEDGHGPGLALPHFDTHLDVIFPPGGGGDIAGQPRLHLLLGRRLRAEQRANSGRDKEIEDDHGRHGIARQTEDRRRAGHGDDGRFARPHADAMDQHSGRAQPGDDVNAHVPIGDGTARRKNHNVAFGVGPGGSRFQRGPVVGNDAVQHRLAAGPACQRGQGVGVDVPHLARPDWLVGRHHLVTGRENPHPGRHGDGYFGDPQGQQPTDILGA